jgi:acyl-CoA thioesterase FadM
MYVWGRMAKMVATTKGRGKFHTGDVSRLTFRCLPTDIDPNMHMNNARYAMIADVGRYDIFIRGGFMRLRRERSWAPMMGGVQCAFLREIRLWKRFELQSTMDCWEGQQILGRHRFVLEDGRTACEILTTAGVYDLKARRFVPMDEVAEALGEDAKSRPPTDAERAFMASHAELRTAGKSPLNS